MIIIGFYLPTSRDSALTNSQNIYHIMIEEF